VKYVLLGGDVDVVPFRKAYAMTCGGFNGARGFAAVRPLLCRPAGSWTRTTHVFGEVDDSVDLYSDLSVGRAPVNDVAQAQTFVRKVLDYEHAVVPAIKQRSVLRRDSVQNPYTDQGVHKDKMEQQSFASVTASPSSIRASGMRRGRP